MNAALNNPWSGAPATGGGGAGNPAGSNGDLQINSSGSFGALTPGTGVATALAAATNGTAGLVTYSGNIGAATGTSLTLSGGGAAGYAELTQGTAPSAGTTSIKIYAPASVTSYIRALPGAAATGFYLGTNASGVVTDTQVASIGSGSVVLSAGALAVTTGKTLTATQTLTLAGTDSTTMTFPATSATIARTDAAQAFTGIQTITNITLPTNGQVLLSIPTTDGHATGWTTSSFNSGYSSSAVGDLVYLDSSATWQLCDANTLALYNGLLGIALAIAASGAPLLVALPGSFVYATAFPTFTVGGPVYMSETPGAVTQTAPTTTDAATRIIGHAFHADKLFFKPDNVYITHT